MTPASPESFPAPRAAEAAPDTADAPGTAEAELTVRVRLDLCYDGTCFSGWARQPGRRTVQGVLEEALGRLLRLPSQHSASQHSASQHSVVAPRLVVAGRTDAGVHARGQVAHADVPAGLWQEVADRAVPRLAGLLPEDVRLRSARRVPAAFDARFSALWRRYSYRVCDEESGPDPLRRHEIVRHSRPLDLHRMNEAAQSLAGEHDFAAFCRKRDGATTIRSLIRLDWAREGPDVAVATVIADAFCHNMVRSLVGALLAVGDGRKPVGWPADVLKARLRDPAVQVAPPHGLCLEEIRYPPDAELAQRAAQTRRMREAGPTTAPGAA